MQNLIQRGEAIMYRAGSDIVEGQLVQVTDRFGVAVSPIANGADGVLMVRGVFEFEKPQTIAFDIGENVYMDDSGDLTPDADNGLIGESKVDFALVGYAVAAAAAESEPAEGDGDPTVRVAINA